MPTQTFRDQSKIAFWKYQQADSHNSYNEEEFVKKIEIKNNHGIIFAHHSPTEASLATWHLQQRSFPTYLTFVNQQLYRSNLNIQLCYFVGKYLEDT